MEEKIRIAVILLERAFTPGRIGPRRYPYSALKEALRVAKLYTAHVYYHDNSFIIYHLETEEETSDCEAIMNGVSTIFNERGWA